MPTCLECFCESGYDGRGLQSLVDRCHPDFICEAETCSIYSPGPVGDGEAIAFILIHPLHYDKERDVIVPDAFQELTKRDLSTLRVSKATKSQADETKGQLIQRGRDKIPPQLRLVDEVCTAEVSKIRSACNDAGERMMAVYDTALEAVPAHASVFTNADVLENKKRRKVVRRLVHEAFSKNRVSYSDFVSNLPS